ncbi:MAG: AarF/ABC1/UbiB kinase family protein [Phycisphaerales bacterium]|nr:AarF/ABC1/UbiB kinase family protein [Phycisphaerales bacterium]
MKPTSALRTIRNVRRAREILTVLVSHGFGDVVQELGLDRLVVKGLTLARLKKPDAELKRVPYSVRIRQTLEELGSTFIKLGQILATRPDLIPPGWAEEFRKLQDDVPQVEFSKIRAQLEAEFPDRLDDVFQSIEPEAIAAASIAQVHRAVLKDGSPVVLKILRPGIRKQIRSDMELLRFFAAFVEDHFANLGYSPTDVVDQFARELAREVDLAHEARSTDRLRRDFKDNDNVSFPKVYWEASTDKVLALEEIKGVLLSRIEDGQFTEDELRTIVATGADAVFRQCLETGFFHADPHPGNIFVLPDCRICFIDCGMTGHIEPALAELLADLVQSVVNVDLDRVIDVAISIGDADPVIAHDRAFRADVWEFISRFTSSSFDQLDVGDLLQDFFDRIRRHHLRCPADMVFLIKAITTIEGVGEQIAPDFDIIGYVRPYIERLVRRRYGIRAMRRRLQNSMIGYSQLAEDLPRQVRSLMVNLERNRLTMNVQHEGLDRLGERIDRASVNIADALFVAALVVGSSILILADTASGTTGVLTVLAIIGYAVAASLTVSRILFRRRR